MHLHFAHACAASAPCSLFAPFPPRACRMRFQALQKPLGPAEGRLIPLIDLMYYAYLALKRSLGLAKQGLKSHCKRRSGQSRCRENMDLPLLTMWLLQRNMVCPLLHCMQYKADKGSDPLSYLFT